MRTTIIALSLLLFAGNYASATAVTTEELADTNSWIESHFATAASEPGQLPFSFVYDGKSSKELFSTGDWKISYGTKQLADGRTSHTIKCADTAGGLLVRCEAIEYPDFPTVEWVMYFKNTASKDSPILEDILPLDIKLNRISPEEFLLHHHEGSSAVRSDYRPFEAVLSAGTEKVIKPFGGRPTNRSMPYFNIELPGEIVRTEEIGGVVCGKIYTERKPSSGVIAVVGWPGQWSAEFSRDQADGLDIRAGQEVTRFLLHPSEEVRTPLIVLQFWRGDYIRSQNIWRRWMVKYNLPRPGGKLLPPTSSPCSSHQFLEMKNANEENQKLFIDRYIEEGLKPDYWWMDAGWYVCKDNEWVNTGTWQVDKERFPKGFRPISDHAHSKGVGTILWFEPERVTPGSWLWENHPEWLLLPQDVPDEVGWMRGWKLFNLGDRQARTWLTNHVDKLLTDGGIDVYRQDFNIHPLWYWRSGDTADRQGITEIRYVTGYLEYWDELLRRNGDRWIDTCAGGGRRNDLETLRRSVPLLRSDYNLSDSLGNQCLGYGIAFWIPYAGTGELHADSYYFWSMSGAHITPCYDVRNKDLNYDLLRRLMSQWRQVADYFYLGDYYPLTQYSFDRDIWMVWQYDLPEAGAGSVIAFRRPHSYTLTAEFPLRGLDGASRYKVTDLESGAKVIQTGRHLMDKGLAITIAAQPGATVLAYKKLN